MKKKFEELRENLDEFVEQNDYPMLVVGCVPEELAYVIKFLQSLDQKHPQDFFLIFTEPFVTQASYMDAVVKALEVQLEGAKHLRAERGDPPFPPMPPALADQRLAPERRLFDLLQFLRTLLPNEQDHSMVVGFLPLECHDHDGYLRLMGTIAPVPDVQPWMIALRIVIYDDRRQRRMLAALRANKVETVLTFEVDFSTPALTEALSQGAADTSLPVAERMACLVQLAALDYSYKRYPDALEKYGVLYKYYEGHGVPSMQSLCLLGAGDTLAAAGKLDHAKETLQRGIALALRHKCLAPLLNLLISVTDVCMGLGHFAEAASYADSGTQVSAELLNPFANADMFEKKGDAEVAQGKAVQGMATYKRCEELCEKYEYFHRWKSVLAKQARWYEQNHMTRERDAARHRLALVEERERRSGQTPPAAPQTAAQATS